ncbi:hypothetical protein [Jiella sonneratiae]|uniref:Uncharacterized protein n=1 Tax=Jiella sonneratiae TaxID=2816856 RepID=A0ABS3IZ92_9HYPH|nr:hypothetical protein [Jiella sonneratiae]MBO0902724.1 hypothetical protein [Jiella sonneratiae]
MAMTENQAETRDNLKYVSDMLEQLKRVAGVERGDLLHYFLDMARLEAENRLSARAAEDPGGSR